MKKLTKKMRDTIARIDAQNTSIAHDSVARITAYLTDARAKDRKADGACRTCFYLKTTRLSGAAFTAWSCRVCKQEQPHYHCTAVPFYCGPCAATHGLCRRCGGTI